VGDGVRVVKWERGWGRSEFLAAVVEAGGLAPGAVVDMEYRHDNGCPKLAGAACRCDPEVTATITPPPEAS
jgi:hypothetical protein